MGIGGGKGLDFGRNRSHTFQSEVHTLEADLWLPDAAHGTDEDDSMLTHYLHELYQVSVMLLRGLAIDTYHHGLH